MPGKKRTLHDHQGSLFHGVSAIQSCSLCRGFCSPGARRPLETAHWIFSLREARWVAAPGPTTTSSLGVPLSLQLCLPSGQGRTCPHTCKSFSLLITVALQILTCVCLPAEGLARSWAAALRTIHCLLFVRAAPRRRPQKVSTWKNPERTELQPATAYSDGWERGCLWKCNSVPFRRLVVVVVGLQRSNSNLQ